MVGDGLAQLRGVKEGVLRGAAKVLCARYEAVTEDLNGFDRTCA
jgi:hypothetical protein